MQAVILSLVFSVLGVSGASAQSVQSGPSLFVTLRPVIRQCVTLPYVHQQGRRIYRDLVSHCDQLKVIREDGQRSGRQMRGKQYRAVLNWSGRIFQIAMTPSAQSDGDFFDVSIRDKNTGKVERVRNVLAYGDILLAVLEGSVDGLKSVRVLP